MPDIWEPSSDYLSPALQVVRAVVVTQNGHLKCHTGEPIRVHDAQWLTFVIMVNRCVATGSNYRHNTEASVQDHSNHQQPLYNLFIREERPRGDPSLPEAAGERQENASRQPFHDCRLAFHQYTSQLNNGGELAARLEQHNSKLTRAKSAPPASAAPLFCYLPDNYFVPFLPIIL